MEHSILGVFAESHFQYARFYLRITLAVQSQLSIHKVMLTFITTMSIADFKEIKKVETIEVKQNPKTSKLFFVYGVETGAVSSRYKQGIPNNDVISLVETDKGDSFFLLHNLNEGPTVSKR